MRTARITPKSTPAIVFCAVAGLALCLAFARPAGAWSDDSDWGDDDTYGWHEERMQDAAIASAEEMAREAGRAVRREEVEEQQAAKSAETQAYYASVMDASRASLEAPRDVYYRKPGFMASEPPPPGSPVVAAGPISLIYDQGIYWFQRGSQYVVAVPPAGVVVDKLPKGIRVIPVKGGGSLYYYFGVFYKSAGGKFEVVKPPAGTVVGYLPDGYTKETAEDKTVFKFGETSFKQVFVQGVLAYQVV